MCYVAIFNCIVCCSRQAAAAVIVTTFVISLAIHVFVAKQFGHKNFLRLISYSTEVGL